MKIIENYRDLPIGMYLEICEVSRRTDIEEIHKQVCIISILAGVSEEDVYNMPVEEYKELAAKARFLEREYDGEVLWAKSYIMGRWTLVPMEDYRKITTAQYIDFQTFAADAERNIVQLLSTMLIPKGKKYNQDYDILEVQSAIRDHMSVAEALSLLAFFFVCYRQSIKDSLSYSKEMAMKLRDPEKKRRILREIQKQEMLLAGNGDGLQM